MDVKFIDNSKKVLSEFDKAVQVGLEAIGLEAEKYAKKNETAVDTGRLRNSISHAVKGNSAYIGSNVEYAKYIEFGTSRMKPLHYLQRACTEHTDRYKQLVQMALNK